MGIKRYKPITNGMRHLVLEDFSEITKENPEKNLTLPLRKTGGRNNQGRKTAWWRGGGHKRRIRIVDFKRKWDGIPAKVVAIEYDPNRSARLALLHYADGRKSYIIAPDGLEVGAIVYSGEDAEIRVGNTLPLRKIPVGTFIHNLEFQPGKGGAIARAAGTYAQLLGKEDKYAIVKLPSGEIRKFLLDCRATIGMVGLKEHSNESLGKAGRSRWLGRKPHVGGTCMNPVDHPHGGGEGKTFGRHPTSRTGIPAKGYKTRKKKKISDKWIVKRRHAAKRR